MGYMTNRDEVVKTYSHTIHRAWNTLCKLGFCKVEFFGVSFDYQAYELFRQYHDKKSGRRK